MLGMPDPFAGRARAARSLFRPRHWAQAKAENPLARFVPFSSLVSPHDVITRGGDYLAASRAYIYVTRDHIVADAAEESGIPSRRYNSVEELEADLDEIEAWPHEDDLAPR